MLRTELSQWGQILEDLVEALHGHFPGTSRLQQQTIPEELKQRWRAYRAIVLTANLHDQGEMKAQFDETKAMEPFRSWSKTEAGARAFAADYAIGQVVILLTGEIEGVALEDLVQYQLAKIQSWIDANEAELLLSSATEFGFLQGRIKKVRSSLARYAHEEEIIAYQVHQWSLKDQYTIQR